MLSSDYDTLDSEDIREHCYFLTRSKICAGIIVRLPSQNGNPGTNTPQHANPSVSSADGRGVGRFILGWALSTSYLRSLNYDNLVSFEMPTNISRLYFKFSLVGGDI